MKLSDFSKLESAVINGNTETLLWGANLIAANLSADINDNYDRSSFDVCRMFKDEGFVYLSYSEYVGKQDKNYNAPTGKVYYDSWLFTVDTENASTAFVMHVLTQKVYRANQRVRVIRFSIKFDSIDYAETETETETETHLITTPFEGFYNTFHGVALELNDGEYDHIQENYGVMNPDIEINFKDASTSYSRLYIDALNENLIDDHDLDLKLKYKDLISPTFYNFVNDSIDATIESDKLKELKDRIFNDADLLLKFKEILKAKFTSYDGFISSHSNDFYNLDNDVLQWDNIELGLLLLTLNEGDNDESELDIYESIEFLVTEYVTDYDKAVLNPITIGFNKHKDNIIKMLNNPDRAVFSTLVKLNEVKYFIEFSGQIGELAATITIYNEERKGQFKECNDFTLTDELASTGIK